MGWNIFKRRDRADDARDTAEEYAGYADDARDDYNDALDNANTAIDSFSDAVEDNKTRTSYDSDGRAFVEQWDPDSGSWTQVKDYNQEYDQLDSLMNMGWDTVEGWAQDNAGTVNGQNRWDYYQQGMADSAGALGTVTEDYQDWARNQAATGLGFVDSSDMESALNSMLDEILAGVNSSQGLTDQEREVYENLGHSNLRQMESDLNRQLDSVAAGGSTMRTLAAADEVRSQMSDARLQNEYAILEADFERRQINYENNRQNYASLVNAGMASEQQYLEAVRSDKINQFQAYATGVSQIMQQRQIDLDAQKAHVETIYQSINASLGISDAAINQANQLYEQSIAPYKDQMAAAISQADMELGAYTAATTAASNKYAQYANDLQNMRTNRTKFWSGLALTIGGGALLVATGGAATPLVTMGMVGMTAGGAGTMLSGI